MEKVESVEEKARRYIRLTEEALKAVKISVPDNSKLYPIAMDMLDVARRYTEDAKYFLEKGDAPTALSAVSYAHAWIDAGVRMGILKGESDRLFMHG